MHVCLQTRFTVQLRYKRTTHMHIIRAYFVYTRMSIHAHMRVYTSTHARIYTCIRLFVMHSHKFLYVKHCWSNKGHYISGNEKGFKAKFHIVKTSYQSMKAIIFQVFDHFANSPTNYRLLTLA